MVCMDRRENMTEEQIKIDDLEKRIDSLERLVTTVSRLLLEKEVYTIEEVLESFNTVMKDEKKAEEKNTINLESEIIVEG